MRLFVVTGQLDLYQQMKMNPEIQKFLENLRSSGEEEKKKIIEEMQKLEMEKQLLSESNEKTESREDRKSFRISGKHTYQRSIQNSSFTRKPMQLDLHFKEEKYIPCSMGDQSFSSANTRHHEQESINRDSTIIKIYAHKDS